ncbi:MAG TPA: hypothetical protein V6D11_18755, partial [Waterburya sp.]
ADEQTQPSESARVLVSAAAESPMTEIPAESATVSESGSSRPVVRRRRRRSSAAEGEDSTTG